MKSESPDDAGLGLGQAADGIEAPRLAHEAMATVFEVICAHEDRDYVQQAAREAFDLVDRLEREMSRFIANSDISRINALSAGQSARVSPETMECLEISKRMHALTGGAFDISIGTGLDRLDLDPDGFVVRARADGVRLDLGGIGKGYAVDRVGELLDEWELRKVLIHGGFSSVLARDAPPGREGWPLTLTAPGGGSRIRISARQMALSASGTRKGAHIQDPETGRAVEGRAAWAVLPRPREGERGLGEEWADAARSPAAVVEALSTAFMILPLNDIRGLCTRSPGLEAWVARGGPGAPLQHLGTPPTG